MKYTKAFLFIAQIGAALVALACGLRILCGLFAMAIPVLDALIRWLYEHAVVGGLMVGIAFLVWWFADECDKQARKERNGKC